MIFAIPVFKFFLYYFFLSFTAKHILGVSLTTSDVTRLALARTLLGITLGAFLIFNLSQKYFTHYNETHRILDDGKHVYHSPRGNMTTTGTMAPQFFAVVAIGGAVRVLEWGLILVMILRKRTNSRLRSPVLPSSEWGRRFIWIFLAVVFSVGIDLILWQGHVPTIPSLC